ncbi:MAG: hypothetical protein HWE15_08750 [Algoriphagus sp.]|uniref:hypothetical protein n=1 Tax=Algoriphagus sp. TaxID=1872435 RepID=UPI0017B13EA0|nr:hypothetical protein [Algoriphagus sp.]NVJ86380.1 hypothetical protein [Algoriphagus sp.]
MNSFFDDLFGKIFKNPSKTPVRVKENYEVKEADLNEIDQWMDSPQAIDIFDRIYRNFHLKRTGIQETPQVHLFQSPYANGFAVTFEPPFTPETFSKLFLAFSRRILALGYKQVSLDRKMEEINDQVKVTEKFYLKPPLQAPSENQRISQLFGNVSIEKISIDNKPSYLKLLVTVYSDRLYEDAQPFDQMIDRLFETKHG